MQSNVILAPLLLAPLLAPVFLAPVFLATVACHGPQPADTSATEAPAAAALWSGEDLRPSLDHDFFTQHDLADLSLYSHCEAGPTDQRPDAAHRGPLAIGNGHAFSLLGLAAPLNRLHSATGPTYDKGTRFFGDHWFTIEVDGVEVGTDTLAFDQECITRPRGTAVVITRADTDDVSLYTVDLAPRLSDGDAPPVLLRFLLVSSDSPHQVRLLHHAWQDLDVVDGTLQEQTSDGRTLAVQVVQGDGSVRTSTGTDGSLAIDLGTIQGDTQTTVVWSTADDADTLATLQATVATAKLDDWLDQTLAWWQDWSAQGLQLSGDDPRVADLYDSIRTTVKVQTNDQGGISPMSRYTGVWLRDTIGPVRFLLRSGLQDDAQAALDYLHACHADNGDYGNACTSGLDPTKKITEPDWANLPDFQGRTAAEGPSYVPLAWLDAAAWTADDSLIDQHWDYVARGLLAQQLDEEGRQTFSGDETWRLVMNVSLGLELEVPWQDIAWSANSSLLMMAAAGRLAEAGRTLGHDTDADALDARWALADNALRQHFVIDDQWITPAIIHTDDGELSAGDLLPQPFEDVSLKALWTGALSVDDPLALSDLQTLKAWAGRGDGTIQSPAAPSYMGEDLFGITIQDGVCTGMLPGYTLAAYTAIGDPLAQQAFNAMNDYAGPTGQFAEDMLYDDKSALQISYDQTGGIGDIAARLRPWESAIDLDAVLTYLVGAEPVAGGARFRPHLPDHQTHLLAEGLKVGKAAGSLLIQGDERSRTVSFTASSAAQSGAFITIELAVPQGQSPTTLSGGELVTLPGGEQLVRFDPVQVSAGDSISVNIGW